jgi:hypothetical protein
MPPRLSPCSTVPDNTGLNAAMRMPGKTRKKILRQVVSEIGE